MNLIFKKEDVTLEDVDETKVVVVLDILLATSTIVTCLAANAKAVYPVVNKEEAFVLFDKLKRSGTAPEDIIIAGEENAKAIEGFMAPLPTQLKKVIDNKHLILLTTNGTSAIRKAEKAKKVYITSLLNTKAVAKKIVNNYVSADITVVCSGSNGAYCLEDFYGAGYFIDTLESCHEKGIKLNDGALTASLFYNNIKTEEKDVIGQSSVGKLLKRMNVQSEIDFISQKDIYFISPELRENKIIYERKVKHYGE